MSSDFMETKKAKQATRPAIITEAATATAKQRNKANRQHKELDL